MSSGADKSCDSCAFELYPNSSVCRSCTLYSNWMYYSEMPQPEATKRVTAYDLLSKASEIMQERGKQYDQPQGERSMAKTVAAFNAVTGHHLSEADGWAFMTQLKLVRLFSVRTQTHQDSVDDLIAYSALLGETATQKGLT